MLVVGRVDLHLNAPFRPRQMPDELLASVFSMLSIPDRTSISLVCRYWHDVLVSWPHIWGNIHYDDVDGGSPDALASQFKLSANCPLTLDVVIGGGWDVICAHLKPHIWRVTHLTIVIEGPFPDSSTASTSVSAVLCQPAPALREFRLFDPAGVFNSKQNSTVCLFGNFAPLLSHVKAQCDISALKWSGLALQSVKYMLYTPSLGMCREHLLYLVQLVPNIAELAIQIHTWSPEPPTNSPSETSNLRLPHSLRFLAVIAHSASADAARLINSLDIRNVPAVWVQYNDAAVSDDISRDFTALYRDLSLTDSSDPSRKSRVSNPHDISRVID